MLDGVIKVMSQNIDQSKDQEHTDKDQESHIGDDGEISEEFESDENVPPSVSDSEEIVDDVENPEIGKSKSIEELEEELAEVKDQLLRAVAETANVRRRAQREKEDAGKYAIANFAREMLSVSDNMVRALNSERLEEEKQANSELSAVELLERFNNFVTGVNMIETEMKKTFERIGIEQIEPLGQPFDPKYHHALFEVEDLDRPAGTVIQVIEAGYLLRERLLREAKVGVTKGGPKLTADETTEESDLSEVEGAAQAYETVAETGSKVDKKL